MQDILTLLYCISSNVSLSLIWFDKFEMGLLLAQCIEIEIGWNRLFVSVNCLKCQINKFNTVYIKDGKYFHKLQLYISKTI